jgi:hypothetical protein
MFFCDPASTQWQQNLYERLHASLRMLHDALDVPYFYFDWRHGLRAAGVAKVAEIGTEGR